MIGISTLFRTSIACPFQYCTVLVSTLLLRSEQREESFEALAFEMFASGPS